MNFYFGSANEHFHDWFLKDILNYTEVFNGNGSSLTNNQINPILARFGCDCVTIVLVCN